MLPDDETPLVGLRLDSISTRVATLQEAGRFVLRYGPAVQRYLAGILKDADAAEEVWQEMMATIVDRGGTTTWPGRGRFRDYLRRSARNAAIDHLRKSNRRSMGPLSVDVEDPASRIMDDDWRRCLLDKVWRALEAAERGGRGGFVHSALRAAAEAPELDSKAQAAALTKLLGRPITAEAFRQQISRGKRMMAEQILSEVAGTIAGATAADVEAELVELGLMALVCDFLPPDWQKTFFGS